MAAGVALDLDSTVFPFVDAVRAVTGNPQIRAENLATYQCISRLCGPYADRAFEAAWALDVQLKMGLMPGAAEALAAFQARRIPVHVMTARPAHVADTTEQFLMSVGLRPSSFACDLHIDKVARCRQLGIDVIVDDHPDTIQRAADAGLRPFTLLYPYNRQVVARLGVPHATSWRQLLPLVLQRLAADVIAA